MKISSLEKLIRIANILETNGFHQESDSLFRVAQTATSSGSFANPEQSGRPGATYLDKSGDITDTNLMNTKDFNPYAHSFNSGGVDIRTQAAPMIYPNETLDQYNARLNAWLENATSQQQQAFKQQQMAKQTGVGALGANAPGYPSMQNNAPAIPQQNVPTSEQSVQPGGGNPYNTK